MHEGCINVHPVLDGGKLRVCASDTIGDETGIVLPGTGVRRIQRRQMVQVRQFHCLANSVFAGIDGGGDFRRGGLASETLGEICARTLNDLSEELETAWRPDAPCLISEVAAQVSQNGRDRETNKRLAFSRIVAIQRPQQSEVPHLEQVLSGSRPRVPEPGHQGADQAITGSHQSLTEFRLPSGAVGGQPSLELRLGRHKDGRQISFRKWPGRKVRRRAGAREGI